MLLSCMDPRFQPIVFNYLTYKKKMKGKYSSFVIAGGAIGVTSNKFRKWHKTFWDNLATSIKIHKIKKLIVVNHKDCGAAKIISKKNLSNKQEIEIHKKSFKVLRKKFKKKYPSLIVEFNLIDLKGRIKKFN